MLKLRRREKKGRESAGERAHPQEGKAGKEGGKGEASQNLSPGKVGFKDDKVRSWAVTGLQLVVGGREDHEIGQV